MLESTAICIGGYVNIANFDDGELGFCFETLHQSIRCARAGGVEDKGMVEKSGTRLFLFIYI